MTTLDALKDAATRDPEKCYRLAGYTRELRPDGAGRLKGLCPFHTETEASFKIHTKGDMQGRWWCYGACDRGGSIVDFFMELHGSRDLKQATEELADRLGVNGSARPRKAARKTPSRPHTEPSPIAEEVVQKLHEALLGEPKRLSFLIEEKGLTREIIERAKIGWEAKAGRYAIPVPYPDGRKGYADIRRYLPNAPKTREKMLAWERGRGSTKLYPWPWVCSEGELVLTEGEVDALNLIARGIPALTATNGKGKWPQEPPDLAGKTILVCGDADASGRKHNDTMPAKLYATGAAEVRIIEWPEGVPKGFDVSDFFAKQNGMPDDFRELMREAGLHLQEDAVANGEGEAGAEPLKVYFDGNRFVPKRVADQLRQQSRLVRMGGQLHVYRAGVYVPEGERFIRRRAQQLLGEQHSRRRADEVVYDVETSAPVLDEKVNTSLDLINVKNGLLDWRTGELKPHTPDHLSTIQLAVAYDPNARGSGVVDYFLQSTLVEGQGDPDNARLTEEFLGYCLIPTTQFETAFCALGGGANGKSVFLHLFEALLGENNVSNIPLQEIAGHKFKRADLFGRLANIFADLGRATLRSAEYFRTVVSGDKIDAERKHKSLLQKSV